MTINNPEVVGFGTHHDEPMLFPSKREAAMYCEDGEEPVALIRLSDYEALQAERDEALAKLAAIESQEPVIRISGGRVVDFNPNYGGSVSDGAFYAKPVPADKPARITEQDAREIAKSYALYCMSEARGDAGTFADWIGSPEGLVLLNKLNADRQVPAVAVPDIATEEMCEALEEVLRDHWFNDDDIGELDKNACWAAMLAAAPSHSQHQPEIQNADIMAEAAEIIDILTSKFGENSPIRLDAEARAKSVVAKLYDQCGDSEKCGEV